MAEERLDSDGRQRLRGLLAAGDPAGEVADAHAAKECLRELYTLYGEPDLAGGWIDALTDDLHHNSAQELRGMAGTLRRWRDQILAWHTTGASNGGRPQRPHQEGQAARRRVPQLRPLPAPSPAPRRRLRLVTPRCPHGRLTPLKRGGPLNVQEDKH